jgi:predicted transcriptional regulator
MTSVIYIKYDRCHFYNEETVLGKKKIQKLSDANLEIMNIVWERGEVTINDVHKEINLKRKDTIKRATIQVQMKRLERYGWLKHKKVGREFYYSALRDQEESSKDILNNVRKKVFGGSRAELVRCLFADSKASSEELDRIMEYLEKIKEE